MEGTKNRQLETFLFKVNGVSEGKVMWEKFLLAIAITFALNLFMAVRFPTDSTATSISQTQQLPEIIVKLPSNR